MKIVLIRHGATKGNLEKRYIGRTDEDLCGEGIKKLKEDTYAGIYPPGAGGLFQSDEAVSVYGRMYLSGTDTADCMGFQRV